MYLVPCDATTTGPIDGPEILNNLTAVIPTVEEAVRYNCWDPIMVRKQGGQVRSQDHQHHSRGVEEVPGKRHAIAPIHRGCGNA